MDIDKKARARVFSPEMVGKVAKASLSTYEGKDQEENVVIDIDMKRSENVRRWWPFLRDRRIECFGNLTKRFID